MSVVSEELIAKLLDQNSELEEELSNIELTVERGVRISESKLISSHNQFYNSWGPDAFRIVPDYISTNAFVASSYTKLILGYIKDLIIVRNNQKYHNNITKITKKKRIKN